MAVGITSTYSGKRKERFGHVSTAKCEEIKKIFQLNIPVMTTFLTGANVMLRSNIPVYTGMEFDLQSVTNIHKMYHT